MTEKKTTAQLTLELELVNKKLEMLEKRTDGLYNVMENHSIALKSITGGNKHHQTNTELLKKARGGI